MLEPREQECDVRETLVSQWHYFASPDNTFQVKVKISSSNNYISLEAVCPTTKIGFFPTNHSWNTRTFLSCNIAVVKQNIYFVLQEAASDFLYAYGHQTKNSSKKEFLKQWIRTIL